MLCLSRQLFICLTLNYFSIKNNHSIINNVSYFIFENDKKFICAFILLFMYYFADNNDSLTPSYEVDDIFFDQKIKELVLRYNYTLNQKGIYEAIKYMYTYWPDPTNKTHIREQYIHVSIC